MLNQAIKTISDNATGITIWCGALCTFAIYSVLYKENKFYRLFEHIFIGLAAGYGVYMTWSIVLRPKWWEPMVHNGQWYWVFAAVLGSMFYFMYSKRHVWISRIMFGLFMGLAAGGMFREFYELIFPQLGASMKPILNQSAADNGVIPNVFYTLQVCVFYAILIACMVYFFFSFEHRNRVVSSAASAGRWFLMIGFGAIFGATVMGRMTLFIGRFNFLAQEWAPQVSPGLSHYWVWVAVAAGIVLLAVILKRHPNSSNE